MKTPIKAPGDQSKITRGPVLLRWFVSYLVILLVSLFLSIAVYFYSLSIINKNSSEIYEASLEQFRIEVDNFINSAYQILQQLAFNPDIQALTMVRDKLQPRDQWNIIQTIREIQKIKFIFPAIDDIFIVLNHQDHVMNSAVYFPVDLFYRLFHENETVNLDAFLAILKETPKNRIVEIANRLFLFQPSVEYIFGDAPATLVISYKKEIFETLFFNSYEANGGKIFIVQENGRTVYGSGDNNEIPSYSGSKGIINDIGYHVLSLDSKVMDWTFLYFYPESFEKDRARQIQIFTFSGLLIYLLIGLFLAYWLSRRNYDPVKKIISIFSLLEKPVKGENEFRWIEQKAIDTQAALGTNLQALRKYFILTLLEKPFDPVTGKHEMERYNINLPGEWNLAAIFMSGFFPGNKTLSESESEIINTLLYVIIHIFTEAAEADFSVEMINTGEYATAIINWTGGWDAHISRLEDIIEFTDQETAEFLHFPVQAALGEPRKGPEGIYFSNLEAKETLRYLDSKNSQTILHYYDIKYSGGKYRYTFETEQKLVNLVRLGDDKAACDLLRQIWAENSGSGSLPGRLSCLLAYNLYGSLIKGMEQDFASDGPIPVEFYPERIPLDELTDSLEKITIEICKSNSLMRQSKREHQLSGKVKEYIDENFRNPDINISITSLHFNISPAYLSTLFKEGTGVSLLEYINTLRIEEGKKLLQSGCEVNEAAEKCGFRGSGAFIRVFKKFTGVTPGQYREM